MHFFFSINLRNPNSLKEFKEATNQCRSIWCTFFPSINLRNRFPVRWQPSSRQMGHCCDEDQLNMDTNTAVKPEGHVLPFNIWLVVQQKKSNARQDEETRQSLAGEATNQCRSVLGVHCNGHGEQGEGHKYQRNVQAQDNPNCEDVQSVSSTDGQITRNFVMLTRDAETKRTDDSFGGDDENTTAEQQGVWHLSEDVQEKHWDPNKEDRGSSQTGWRHHWTQSVSWTVRVDIIKSNGERIIIRTIL